MTGEIKRRGGSSGMRGREEMERGGMRDKRGWRRETGGKHVKHVRKTGK